MEIIIRKFNEEDVPYKVKWINDSANNKYLHYDMPLKEEKTLLWYNKVKHNTDRLDCTILCDGQPVGLIGLLNIDLKNKKAEFYICLGEKEFKSKGVARKATELLIEDSFQQLKLEKIYLYTEVENLKAQTLFERVGFVREGLLRKDLIYNGQKIDRYVYSFIIDDYN